MLKRTQLSLAISAVVGITSVTASSVYAQEVLEEVYVTGTRIARNGFEMASPVDVFTAEDLAESGIQSVDEFLMRIPAFTGGQLGASTNNGNTGTGAKMVNLRGLGNKRTLVLIDGRRQVSSFIGASDDIGAVDLNSIPMSMIERIEVLKDGASTAYGTDAIAGVVNLILKKRVEGVEISGEMGYNAKEWDGKNEAVSVVMGTSNDKGGITFGMEYNKQNEVKAGDRDFSKNAVWPIKQPDGRFVLENQGSSNSRTIRTSSAGWSEENSNLLPGGPGGSYVIDETTGEVREFGGGDTYNYAPVNALVTPTERWQISALGDQEIFSFKNGTVRVHGEGMYTNRNTSQRLAPDASFQAVQDANGVWNDTVPANNPYNPFGDSGDNPWGIEGEDVRVNRRFEESGGRQYEQNGDTYRMVVGFDGDYNDINWDVSYVFAEDKVTTENLNLGRFDRWQTAVDPDLCAADSGCLEAMGSAGVLDPTSALGSFTPEQMSYLLTGSLKDIYKNRLTSLTVDLDGEFGSLPGGSVGWAAGYQTRSESASFSPDEFLAGGLTTSGSQDPLSAAFRVDEFYIETLLPLLSDAPFAKSLTVEASMRYSDYNTEAGDTDNYRAGVDWAITDSWRVRSVYSTGFRAPNIVELVGGQSADFPIAENYCEFYDTRSDATDNIQANCAAAGVEPGFEQGFQWQSLYVQESPDSLDPEESESFSLGVVWTPENWPDFQVSVDYWDIQVDDIIGKPDYNGLLRTCLDSADQSTELACSYFDYGTGLDSPFPDNATAQLANQGKLETNGIDYAVDYVTDVNWGVVHTFEASLMGTYMDEYKETYPGSGNRDLVGTAGANSGSEVYPENRINARFGVRGNNWTAAWTMRWIDESEDLLRPSNIAADAKAEDMLYHDIVGTYSYKNVNLSVGIDNVTDEEPPYFHSAFNANTAPQMYDVFGMRAWTRISVNF